MRLYLTGYMGTGKSTLGRKIAKRTELPFLDTDKMVEEAEGAEVADIITYAGEEYFREAERRALEKTAEVEDAIISTGGGLPVWGDNQAWMAERGVLVYLKRTPEQILSRLSPHGRFKRPKLRGLSDEEVLQVMRDGIAEREPIYEKADIVFDCSQTSDWEIVDRLCELVKNADE
ncbi:MAG: shikimate kinase [Alistipes sp.]|nr:shikimate kinase [Alistipes sp.]